MELYPIRVPFSGYKKSGTGCETHKVILYHHTQMKRIFIGLSEGYALVCMAAASGYRQGRPLLTIGLACLTIFNVLTITRFIEFNCINFFTSERSARYSRF